VVRDGGAKLMVSDFAHRGRQVVTLDGRAVVLSHYDNGKQGRVYRCRLVATGEIVTLPENDMEFLSMTPMVLEVIDGGLA